MSLDGVCDIHFARRRLCVRAVPPPDGPPLEVRIGSLALPLLPVRAEQGPRLAPHLSLAATQGDGYQLRINHSQDWMVAGLTNAQLQLRDRQRRREVRLGPPVLLPEGFGLVELRASLAAHRARGLFSLRIRYPDGGAEERLTAAFDPAWGGGKTLAGYRQVTLRLPQAEARREISLWAEFRLATEPLSKHDPYLFVTWPRLVPVDTGEPGGPVEPVVIGGAPLPKAEWFEAEIPRAALVPGAEVALCAGVERLTVFKAMAAGVILARDRGHELALRAEAPLEAVAWIDDRPAFPLRLDTDAVPVLLPARELTGSPGRLELRDPSGSQTLFESWILRRDVAIPPETLQREGKPPFAPRLLAASEARFLGLRAHIAAGANAATLAQLGRIVDALEDGPERSVAQGWLEGLLPLAFPEEDDPEVSVIVPAHNHLAFTHACLASLLLAHNRCRFEVVLVDDGSTDDTARIEERVRGLRLVRNATPQRFLRACMAGAEAARAPFLVFLNNDTEVTPGWLDALRDAFARFDRVGLAGAKLLHPDGRLQEAGGIVWNNGQPWRYGGHGGGLATSDPRVSYARQVDYVSGAAMMVSREAWQTVGGFTEAFAPMYFEDTDLAFKLRAAGFTTWYVPEAVVFHHEGLSSGTDAHPDAGTGMKRFQAINQPEFRRRWARACAGHATEGTAADLEKDRNIVGRVLFVDSSLPRPDRDAGSHAALQEIRLVQSLGYKITFLPANLGHLGGYAQDLQRMGVEVITAPFALSPEAFIEARGHEFDAAYITRYHVALSVLHTLRTVKPDMPVILNNADLHFLRLLRASLATADADRQAEAAAVREEELDAIHRVDLTLSYSDVERAVIESFAERPVRVARCPWVIDPPAEVPARKGRAGLSFLGSFAHHPNVEALDWFARAVLPGLTEAAPGLVLSVYGAAMGARQRALAGPMLRPVGHVAEVAEAYNPHLVFVAPLLSGAGIKGKVIGALAHGIPCVLSPVAAEATGLRHGWDVLIVESPEEWQRAILSLTEDAALWTKLSENGRALVADRFSFARGRDAMRSAFEAVGLFGMLP